jgi:ABC-type multidrug transport system fused ATPase/permease subunit
MSFQKLVGKFGKRKKVVKGTKTDRLQILMRLFRKYPLFRTLWRTVGWKYALNGFFRLANIFLRFAPPYFLRKIILFMSSEDENIWSGLGYVLALFLISVLYFATLNYDNRITSKILINVS